MIKAGGGFNLQKHSALVKQVLILSLHSPLLIKPLPDAQMKTGCVLHIFLEWHSDSVAKPRLDLASSKNLNFCFKE